MFVALLQFVAINNPQRVTWSKNIWKIMNGKRMKIRRF